VISSWIRRHLIRVLLLLLLLALAGTGCGSGTEAGAFSGAHMAEGNRLYQAGQYGDAAARYEDIVASGVTDGRLYYNLGNAHFKAGYLGRAVLNYRRAQRLLPRDTDVATNLELARARTLDRLDAAHEGAIISSLRRVVGWTTLQEAAVVALLLWIAVGSLGIAAILWQRRRRILLALASIAAALMALTLFSIGLRVWDERGQPPAVVVVDEVSVHSGPGSDYLTEFLLHTGTEVRVVEERAEWLRIALPGDLQGWVPAQSAIRVIPER
jgi:tetratricopeptide (TPR) repeat protein